MKKGEVKNTDEGRVWCCNECEYLNKLPLAHAPTEVIYCINCGLIKPPKIDNQPKPDTFEKYFKKAQRPRKGLL